MYKSFAITLFLTLGVLPCIGFQQPTLTTGTPLRPPAELNRNLYRADVDAAEEIQEKVTAAGKEHKHVLLVFGGNWCLDCHVLDNGFHVPRVASILNSNFEVVHVDIGEYNKNLNLAEQYGIPLKKGVPAVAVLDGKGRLLHSQKNGDFEAARRMTEEDLIAFLNKWKPPTRKQ